MFSRDVEKTKYRERSTDICDSCYSISTLKLYRKVVPQLVRDWLRKVSKYKGKCVYCRIRKWSQIDHFFPRNTNKTHIKSTNQLCNLVPVCTQCNRKKSNKDPYKFQMSEFGEIRHSIFDVNVIEYAYLSRHKSHVTLCT